MKPDDICQCEIDGISLLRNTIALEAKGLAAYDIVFMERDGQPFTISATSCRTSRRCCVLVISWASSAGARSWSLARASTPSAIPTTSICSIQTGTASSCSPIVSMDDDDPPVVWDMRIVKSPVEDWGLPPRSSWFLRRSRFLDCEVPHPPATDAREVHLGLTVTEKGD